MSELYVPSPSLPSSKKSSYSAPDPTWPTSSKNTKGSSASLKPVHLYPKGTTASKQLIQSTHTKKGEKMFFFLPVAGWQP